VQLINSVRLDRLVHLIRHNAKLQNVTGHAKRRQCNHKTTEKMNGNAYASAKSKELQPTAQADTVAAHLLLPNRTTKTNNTLTDKNRNAWRQILI
jgi:hypothetical protein